MSDQQASANPPANTQQPCRAPRGRFWIIIAVVAVVSGGIGAVAARGHHFHRAFMGAPMLLGAPGDQASAEQHAGWIARQFARHVDATAEQKTKINAIAVAAATDLLPLHDKMKGIHDKSVELLRQPAVSRDDIEKLRTEHMTVADAISKRIAQAIGDMAEVLTLEQRKGLADDISYFARHWQGKHG